MSNYYEFDKHAYINDLEKLIDNSGFRLEDRLKIKTIVKASMSHGKLFNKQIVEMICADKNFSTREWKDRIKKMLTVDQPSRSEDKASGNAQSGGGSTKGRGLLSLIFGTRRNK